MKLRNLALLGLVGFVAYRYLDGLAVRAAAAACRRLPHEDDPGIDHVFGVAADRSEDVEIDAIEEAVVVAVPDLTRSA